MTSRRRIESNRRNALKSSGPKTERGKHHASLNALSYGIHATALLLPLESETEHGELFAAVLADTTPVGPIENVLACQIVRDIWRLKRLEYAENAQLSQEIHTRAIHRSCEPEVKAIHDSEPAESYYTTGRGRYIDDLIKDVYEKA